MLLNRFISSLFVESCVKFIDIYTFVVVINHFYLIVVLLFQGATIKSEDDTGKIVIARVMHGGAADRSGLIHVGDEVVEVNGINVEGKTPNDVLAILVSYYL